MFFNSVNFIYIFSQQLIAILYIAGGEECFDCSDGPLEQMWLFHTSNTNKQASSTAAIGGKLMPYVKQIFFNPEGLAAVYNCLNLGWQSEEKERRRQYKQFYFPELAV